MCQCKGTNCEANMERGDLVHSPECVAEYEKTIGPPASMIMTGDMFNRIAEFCPEITHRLAGKLDVNIGQLRRLVFDGAVTIDIFIEAVISTVKPPKRELKLSEQLKQDHECGDFGNALEGYAEKAENLERVLMLCYNDTYRGSIPVGLITDKTATELMRIQVML